MRYRSRRILGNQEQLLVAVPWADRNDHATAGPQLIEQRWWYVARRSGDDDRVKWCALRPAETAITGAQFDVVAPLSRKDGRRAGRELRDHLDRADAAGKLGKHRSLIARAGAYLEYGVLWLQVEQLGHQGDDKRLRNRLTVPDRQRPVLVGRILGARCHKCLAPDLGERCGNPWRKRRAACPMCSLVHLGSDLGQQCRALIHGAIPTTVSALRAKPSGV